MNSILQFIVSIFCTQRAGTQVTSYLLLNNRTDDKRTHTHTHVHTCTRLCNHIISHVRMHACTHTHTHTHTHRHTHTYVMFIIIIIVSTNTQSRIRREATFAVSGICTVRLLKSSSSYRNGAVAEVIAATAAALKHVQWE